MAIAKYTEDDIKSLEWREHIRTRPGMYIGKLGDGSAFDDGIYVLLKEVMDNSIDEFMMGAGKKIDFLNASESYLPPVFILDTTSTTLPSGIPRP